MYSIPVSKILYFCMIYMSFDISTKKKICNYDKCCNKHNNRNRDYQNNPLKLYKLISKIKLKKYGKQKKSTYENTEEIKYKNYNYNGSFHKGLQHNLVDGRLVSPTTYKMMVEAIVNNDQKTLASIPLATGATVKLVNPLASHSTMLTGLIPDLMTLDDCPQLFSNQGAAEMVELYALAVARDIPFNEYNKSAMINHLLQTSRLNNTEVLTYLMYAPAAPLLPFTPQTIFRGIGQGELDGPYVSQFLLLDVVGGALKTPQKYSVPPTLSEAKNGGFRVDWGVSLQETINIQNGNLQLLPPATPSSKIIPKYIYSGRSLAEACHNDYPYQLFLHAALILYSLGAQTNSTWPNYPNQASFISNNGSAGLTCMLGEISGIALKHAWYWKWLHYRKLRPEAFALWTHDVKAGLVPNKDNFDISDILLNNHVLNDMYVVNNSILPGSNSYTLSLSYREGSPLHPAYISGHAIIAGACITIIKMFFNGDQKWNSLPGVVSGILSGIPNAVVQANNNGTILETYSGDISNITISTELNKLASNVAIARNFAGIHYRTDAIRGILLGELIAIDYMRDMLSTMVENNADSTIPEIRLRKYDGTLETIKATIYM
ncbi:phosphoesterase-like protein [Tupanvirus deep ocean]|uniref:Phosphoesterase-like protein n=2 Tax=Tupanvirus TaxID=2094720 RepID=A0AC62A7I2_9VIRU|nr:phosphoesterase-like protein [Tupanvirus deep ocean]QKU33736.1 phosphoesterase-like protein [Tupanvirus deep ocean]